MKPGAKKKTKKPVYAPDFLWRSQTSCETEICTHHSGANIIVVLDLPQLSVPEKKRPSYFKHHFEELFGWERGVRYSTRQAMRTVTKYVSDYGYREHKAFRHSDDGVCMTQGSV